MKVFQIQNTNNRISFQQRKEAVIQKLVDVSVADKIEYAVASEIKGSFEDVVPNFVEKLSNLYKNRYASLKHHIRKNPNPSRKIGER